MARINKLLFERIESKLHLSRRRVYELVEEKVRQTHLPRHLAAIALASEHGINISRFASAEDLASIRQTAIAAMPPPVIAPLESKGSKISQPSRRRGTAKLNSRPRRRGTTVFVVHGRNEKARASMFAFLRTIGLQPIEWNQAIKMTGEPTPYVGSILETAFREAVAVVVLLTPDDEVRLKKNYWKKKEHISEKKFMGQSRPNVLFEAGMAFGRNSQNTVLVQLGEVKKFSDVAGRHIVRLSNDPTSRQSLATRLANAGCNVDTSGTDWLNEGDFSY